MHDVDPRMCSIHLTGQYANLVSELLENHLHPNPLFRDISIYLRLRNPATVDILAPASCGFELRVMKRMYSSGPGSEQEHEPIVLLRRARAMFMQWGAGSAGSVAPTDDGAGSAALEGGDDGPYNGRQSRFMPGGRGDEDDRDGAGFRSSSAFVGGTVGVEHAEMGASEWLDILFMDADGGAGGADGAGSGGPSSSTHGGAGGAGDEDGADGAGCPSSSTHGGAADAGTADGAEAAGNEGGADWELTESQLEAMIE